MCEAANLKILMHAPTAAALASARSNASNLVAEVLTNSARIVVNAGTVIAVLDDPNVRTDTITLICPNTLKSVNEKYMHP